MSADIIILPSARVECADDLDLQQLKCVTVGIHIAVSGKDWDRLLKRAREWRMSPEQAAAAIVSAYLNPKSGTHA